MVLISAHASKFKTIVDVRVFSVKNLIKALCLLFPLKLQCYALNRFFLLSREDVEKCKQKDLLAEMLAEMTGDFPTLYKVFVSERDQYLARSLRLSAVPIEIHNSDGGEHRFCSLLPLKCKLLCCPPK